MNRMLVGCAIGVACLLGSDLSNAQRVIAADSPAPVIGSVRDMVLRTPVTVSLSRSSLKQALATIAKSADVTIQYRRTTLEHVDQTVSIQAKQMPLDMVLGQVLRGTSLQASVSDAGIVTVAPVVDGLRQVHGIVAGTVMNTKTQQPVANAAVLVRDSVVATTGSDGTFRVSVAEGVHRVTIRALGFVRQVREVTVRDGQTTPLAVALEPSASVLDAVVVTGTVVATERRAIPNPITVITAEEIERRGISRVEELLRGEVPGVTALELGSNIYDNNRLGAMATAEVYSRGSSNIAGSGTSTPTPLKTYVDGVELLDASYLGTLDPSSIERIEIITGPQAATVYGSGAMGGVMQIFTKRGTGNATPDVTVRLKYGTLENNLSDGLTPSHDHGLSISGGTGAEFSYTGTLSYRYTGQWQPKLFNRSYGLSAGITHARGPVTVSGTVSATFGRNGTFGGALRNISRYTTGELNAGRTALSQIRGGSSSQTVSLNLDYKILPFWQHHFTIGRTQTSFVLEPTAPRFWTATDTLFRSQSSNGQRTSVAYNNTIHSSVRDILTSNLTLGVTGSLGEQTRINGCLPSKSSTSYVGCTATSDAQIGKSVNDQSWGGFGSWNIGFFNQLYVTLGLRGERNPNYGRARKVDWTPTNGISYTREFGQVAVKVLGSYGRATRPPLPEQRLESYQYIAEYEPNPRLLGKSNPDLTPEYSRGPQGGIELYYGSKGSLTVTHYQQVVSDLIQWIRVDTTSYKVIATGEVWPSWLYQYVNTATIRQRGWEGTGMLSLGRITIKGTYSWNDTRIRTNARADLDGVLGQPGQVFTGSPSRTGNVTIGYAHGATSFTLVTNYMGKMLKKGCGITELCDLIYTANLRDKMYASFYNSASKVSEQTVWAASDYTKTNVAVSHRIRPWASVTLNVNNLGNSYSQEGWSGNPALGRQTLLGVSLRYP